MIRGTTSLIAHVGYPTHSFKSPSVYNPYFAHAGIDTVLVPMACQADDYPAFLRALFNLKNVVGAVVTMPHKVSTVGLLDVVSPAVQIAGACNAVRRLPDGRLEGDLFDGEGFVRGLQRAGCELPGRRALVVGSGGVGSAIAASLAAAGLAELALFDSRPGAAQALAQRIATHYPSVNLATGHKDPTGFDLVVNATPLGMQPDDPLAFDSERLQAGAFVCDVVHSATPTPLLQAAQARGARIQGGADMLYEQIPAYLAFFGLPGTTPDVLRSL